MPAAGCLPPSGPGPPGLLDGPPMVTLPEGQWEPGPDDPPAPSRIRWRTGRRAAALLCLVAAVFLGWFWWQAANGTSGGQSAEFCHSCGSRRRAGPGTGNRTGPRHGRISRRSRGDSGGNIIVHVAGAVVRAGIVELPQGSRLHEAIAAAGGSAPGADPDQLNLAAVLEDGQKVLVPRQGETVPAATCPGRWRRRPGQPDGQARRNRSGGRKGQPEHGRRRRTGNPAAGGSGAGAADCGMAGSARPLPAGRGAGCRGRGRAQAARGPAAPGPGLRAGPAHGTAQPLAAVRRRRRRPDARDRSDAPASGRPGPAIPAGPPACRPSATRRTWLRDRLPPFALPQRATPAREERLRRTDVRLVPSAVLVWATAAAGHHLHPAGAGGPLPDPAGGRGVCSCSGHRPVAEPGGRARWQGGWQGDVAGGASGTPKLPRNDGRGAAPLRGSGRPRRRRLLPAARRCRGRGRRCAGGRRRGSGDCGCAPAAQDAVGRSGLADRWAVPATLIEMNVARKPRARARQAAGHGWRRLGTCRARAAAPHHRQARAGRAGPGRSGRPLGKLCPADARGARALAAGSRRSSAAASPLPPGTSAVTPGASCRAWSPATPAPWTPSWMWP